MDAAKILEETALVPIEIQTGYEDNFLPEPLLPTNVQNWFQQQSVNGEDAHEGTSIALSTLSIAQLSDLDRILCGEVVLAHLYRWSAKHAIHTREPSRGLVNISRDSTRRLQVAMLLQKSVRKELAFQIDLASAGAEIDE